MDKSDVFLQAARSDASLAHSQATHCVAAHSSRQDRKEEQPLFRGKVSNRIRKASRSFAKQRTALPLTQAAKIAEEINKRIRGKSNHQDSQSSPRFAMMGMKERAMPGASSLKNGKYSLPCVQECTGVPSRSS